jgi:hypothetical protein
MKQKTKLNRWMPSALAGLGMAVLALLSSTTQTQAQFPINASYQNNFAVGANTAPFKGSGSVASWITWYSTPGGNLPMTNDVTMPDPAGGAGSGSLWVVNPFSAAHGFGNTNNTQNLFFGTFGNGAGYDFSVEANLLNFDYVSFDVFVGTNAAFVPDSTGGWGTLNVGVITAGYSYEQFAGGSVHIPGNASNTWVHIQVPIDHTLAGITTIPGICFDYNMYSGYPTNDINFWIGNLVVHYSGLPPPPPSGTLTKVVPGLTQFADKLPNYNRQDIRTDQSGTANLTWVGNPGATFSWTIAAFPSGAYSNFLSGLSLTPDSVASQNYSDPDWTSSNDLWIAIQNNADGTATAGIAWKTNQPQANSQLYSATAGQLIPYNNQTNGFTVPSAVGTWTLTFVDNTHVTLTAPNGASTNAVLDPNFVALCGGYIGAYLYSSPTVNANIGQYCTYSKYQITGVGTPVNENLTSGALSSPFLVLNSQAYYYAGNYTNAPPNQVWATNGDVYWFAWTLPDANFSPISGSNIATKSSWGPITGNVFQNGATHVLELTKAQLPSTSQGYFGLIKRVATQLQVLLPGQTNAPNTALGYTGTPTPISLAAQGTTPTTITVNACDANWNIVSVTDEVQITGSSDSAAFLPASNVFMAGGTALFTGANGVLFQTTGPQTVTAGDISEPSFAPATSAAVTITP